MPHLELNTEIAAPIERVFDLARSIDAHQQSQMCHQEKAVAGRTSGLIEIGETVTWEAVHLGVRQRLTSRIVAMERPTHFRDTMVRGAFQGFDHDHFFAAHPRGTIMKDVFDYTSPLGGIGRLADVVFLERYLRNLLTERNAIIKQLAETKNPAAG